MSREHETRVVNDSTTEQPIAEADDGGNRCAGLVNGPIVVRPSNVLELADKGGALKQGAQRPFFSTTAYRCRNDATAHNSII